MILFNAIFAFCLDAVKIKSLQFVNCGKARRSMGHKSDLEEEDFVYVGILRSTSSKEEELEGHFVLSFCRCCLRSVRPFPSCFLRPPVYCGQNNKMVDTFSRIFLHNLPAYIMDFVALLSGRKPSMVNTIGKMHHNIRKMTWYARCSKNLFTP